jgi:hypothetical protein
LSAEELNNTTLELSEFKLRYLTLSAQAEMPQQPAKAVRIAADTWELIDQTGGMDSTRAQLCSIFYQAVQDRIIQSPRGALSENPNPEEIIDWLQTKEANSISPLTLQEKEELGILD